MVRQIGKAEISVFRVERIFDSKSPSQRVIFDIRVSLNSFTR